MRGGEHTDPLADSSVAGRYRVLERIGRGGMGTVYRAHQIAMRRDVALKVLRQDLAGDPTTVTRFEREAHAAARITSPHVVTIFEHGRTEAGDLYIAMELLHGGSLAARLESGPLPLREALRIARSIARALEAAHAVGVVHRDLKPDNVFPGDEEWPLKVIDFGIARVLEGPETDPGTEDKRLTRAGAIVGTPAYMSPEGAGRRQVGPAADVYALGVMLFEMLVGRVPFDDPEAVMVLGMHLRLDPELLEQVRPELRAPPSVQELLDALLAKQPERRPTAAEVVRALDAIVGELSREPTGSSPLVPAAPAPAALAVGPHAAMAPPGVALATPMTAEGAPRAARTLPWPMLGAGCLVALGVVGAIVTFVVVLRAELQPEPPTTTAVTLPPPPPASAVAGVSGAPVPADTTDAAEVEVRVVSLSPPTATLFWDGAPRDHLTFRVPRDGLRHTLRATADGYQPLEISLVANGAQTVPLLQLAPLPAASREAAPRTLAPRVRHARRTSRTLRVAPPAPARPRLVPRAPAPPPRPSTLTPRRTRIEIE